MHQRRVLPENQRKHCLFERLASVNFKLSRKKCSFFQPGVEYLGHFISARGIQPQGTKLDALRQARAPQTVSEVRSFLGLTSYYRKLVPEYAAIAEPLTRLLRKNSEWSWETPQQEAFGRLIDILTIDPVLSSPDWTRPFTLTTDGSTAGIAAVLTQQQQNGEHAIAYVSRALSPAERNYSATHLEGLAVVWAVRHFHHYLAGRRFLLLTDHSALVSLFTKDTVFCGCIAR